jgi:hypothetical protein
LSRQPRKGWLDSLFSGELELKGLPPLVKRQTGLEPQVRGPEVLDVYTLLSFQRPSTTG